VDNVVNFIYYQPLSFKLTAMGRPGYSSGFLEPALFFQNRNGQSSYHIEIFNPNSFWHWNNQFDIGRRTDLLDLDYIRTIEVQTRQEENMKKNIRLLSGLMVLSLMLCGAQNVTAAGLDAFKDEKGILRISGGTAHIPVMKEAAKRIMTSNPDIQITIAGGGSGAGIKQVGEGLVDIGNSGRKPTDSEISKYNLFMYQWAIDGVTAVVHPDNPVKRLSSKQLQDIYAGRIAGWKTIGGDDRPINIYTRDNASGTRAVFWKKALGKGDISEKAHFVASNGAMKSAVTNDPYAIGYVSVGYIDESIAPVALDNIMPGLKTVQSGEYKVARGLYSNTKGEFSGLAKKFIQYLLSPEGQQIAAEKGFIPVN
jgi:phosphate transport system substrate-binding protein